MTKTTAQATQNEPSQSAIDAVSLSIISLATKEKDDKQGKLRAAYKTADLRGLNTEAGKIALKLVKGGNEAIDAYFKEFEKTAEYVQILGKSLTPSQYELFGEKRGPAPEDERATIEGRAAGFDIDPDMSEEKNPYDPGSSKGQAWLAAFRQARTERNAILAMPMPVAPTDDVADEEEDT